MNKKEIVFIILPSILWYISFGLFYEYFVIGILISAIILGFLSIAFFKGYIFWIKIKSNSFQSRVFLVLLGIFVSFLLYIIFILGAYFLNFLKLGYQVNQLYGSIFSVLSYFNFQLILYLGLIIIGFFEEVFWRGALQEIIGKYISSRTKEYWMLSALYYTLVHLPALNLALLAAALTIGFVNGFVASRLGIFTTIIAHILWLEYVILFPLSAYIR